MEVIKEAQHSPHPHCCHLSSLERPVSLSPVFYAMGNK
ncbi:rCG32076, isoform CRA_a [Rattus norvegicus]|uniref:RCG32076, isoform CRA_a n=1 Tax=Rattus norvegicus TaxID=10116 RepID=A6JX34_RAT|nr:rCG32076, isoform CRA_a [Rattus norvegicus]